VKLQVHPEAEEELFHDAAWYDADRIGLGDEFLAHIYRWFDVILESPHAWPKWQNAPDLPIPIRRVVVGRFPHSVCYQAFPDIVLVLAVASGRREPSYWRHRAG
jgi:toxin ParE1/3/4